MKPKSKLLSLLVAAALAFTTICSFTGCDFLQKPSAGNEKVTNSITLIARASDSKVTLSWTTTGKSGPEKVTLYQGTTKDSLEQIAEVESKTQYVVEDLTNETTYYFKATAVFGEEEKDSDVVSAKPAEKKALSSLSSVEFAKELTIGWNLGNAFDASNNGAWAYNEGVKLEYNWLPHKQPTSHQLIKTVKAAGFDTIRIPISWHNHMSKTDTTNYKIDSAWMNRVKEVVDWAIAEDMYVIINIHHDNQNETDISSNPGFCIATDATTQKKSKEFIQKVWEQICTTFNDDYDEKLIFEVLNEPRCIDTDYEWGFWGSNASKAKTYCDVITAYEQVALDTIRASGGNNADRFVMVPGYAASPSYLSSYTLPTDTATDKLLLSTHAYTPSDFALNGDKSDYDANKSYIEGSIDSVFNDLSKNYVNKGLGVVMGEASASDKKNLESREKWVKYYFAKAKTAGIPIVLWDNEVTAATNGAGGENHGYFNRQNCQQYYPTLIDAMMKVIHGDDFEGNPVSPTDPDPSTQDCGLLSEPLDLNSWTINVTIPASAFASATNSTSIEFTAEANGGSYSNIKLQATWDAADVLSKGTVTGANKGDGVFEPNLPGTMSYTPTAEEWTKIKSSGLIVYGYGCKITCIKLK